MNAIEKNAGQLAWITLDNRYQATNVVEALVVKGIDAYREGNRVFYPMNATELTADLVRKELSKPAF